MTTGKTLPVILIPAGMFLALFGLLVTATSLACTATALQENCGGVVAARYTIASPVLRNR